MTEQIDWLHLLLQCKNRIIKKIAPLQKTLNQPQPDLGTGAGGDSVKQVDLAAEKAIITCLEEHGISFTLVSEESGVQKYGGTPHKHYVVVDPIDGTTNMLRGISFWGTSIAVSTKPTQNTIHTALVSDLTNNTTYTAQKGKGAYRNNKRISPSKKTALEEAVIGIDLNTFAVQGIIPQISRLIRETRHIRHLGANALELCYVADGVIEAFIDVRGKLRATDLAAAWLIIIEAGAKIADPTGKPLDFKLSPTEKVALVATANREIHKNILKLLDTERK